MNGNGNGKHTEEEKEKVEQKPKEDEHKKCEEKEEEKKIDVDTKGKKISNFRNYVNSDVQQRVQNFYHEQHKNQSFDHVSKVSEKYLKFELAEMSMWECLEYMDNFVDNSDPDTEASQMQHALQTAEAIRTKYPGEEYDWFHLTGLIHDLGKIISFKGGEPQWGTVGDTFPVGCAFSSKCVFPQYFEENPDHKHPVYSTEYGVYKPNCGLDKVKMCFGHDEYLYQACVHNKCTLPPQALYMIRFHSFYPWHREGAYTHLTNEEDQSMLQWILKFNQFDLYSKAHEKHSPEKLRPYYEKVIRKYFPEKLRW